MSGKLNKILFISLLSLTISFLARADVAGRGTVFLGDSITHAGPWGELFPDIRVLNQGVPGDTTLDIMARLPQAMETKPDKVFLMAGINDLWQGHSPGRVAADYKKMVRKIITISPGTRIFIQSVLPVNNEHLAIRIDNRSVRELNGLLKSMAGELGLFYIDLTRSLSDPKGQLGLSYTYDGVHLKKEAYWVWRSVIFDVVHAR